MPCPFRSGARKSVASRQESRVRNQTRRAHAVLVLLTANIWLLTPDAKRPERSDCLLPARKARSMLVEVGQVAEWQTHSTQNRAGKPVWVRLPPWPLQESPEK